MAADLDLVRRLSAAEQGLVVVSVARADGSVHASVVNAGVLDNPSSGQPCIGLVARGDARKLVLLRRNGRATVVFRSGWEWAAVQGPVRLIGPDDPFDAVDPDEVPALLRSVFVAAGGAHDDWDEYDRVMARERRTAVLVAPERIVSN